MKKLHYRLIKTKKAKQKLADAIWNAESKFPRWFRDARKAWTPTKADFIAHFKRASEVWGFYRGKTLLATIFLDIEEDNANIHFAVIGKPNAEQVLLFFQCLVAKKQSDGINNMRCFILKQNRMMLRLAASSGFTASGLALDYGITVNPKNKKWSVLQWLEMVRV